ncbi:MAG: flagellar basal body L-ring protein FlgH [Alteromonadaceae bacterium]|nr:flagellar basal body L-ring protein FlgH [Alteromonadaceae bacterium]
MKYVMSIAICFVFLSGCASVQEAKVLPDDPNFAPILPEDDAVNIVPTGSLFNTNFMNNIYSDSKARRVGDIISVILNESTQANKSSKTELKKENTTTLKPIIGFGGKTVNFQGNSIGFGADQKSNFKGDSKADQGNSLNGNISVNVLKVLSNGNLIIRGEKWMTLNNGDEYIRLTGIIRSLDISANNTITSNKIANARIQYSGTGSFADVQEQGWLSKFFNSGWWPL